MGELTLTHVGPIGEVEDGKTLFSARQADGMTYVLIRDTEVDFGCWTWGHRPEFSENPPVGCDEIEPVIE